MIKGHAEYQLARSAEVSGAESINWSKELGNFSVKSKVTLTLHRWSTSLSRAVDLLPRVPPGPGLGWLRALFEHPLWPRSGSRR